MSSRSRDTYSYWYLWLQPWAPWVDGKCLLEGLWCLHLCICLSAVLTCAPSLTSRWTLHGGPVRRSSQLLSWSRPEFEGTKTFFKICCFVLFFLFKIRLKSGEKEQTPPPPQKWQFNPDVGRVNDSVIGIEVGIHQTPPCGIDVRSSVASSSSVDQAIIGTGL